MKYNGDVATNCSPGVPCVLVVDDNPVTLRMACSALERHGFKVLEARDAQGALQLAADASPDLILQDLMLPDMDGLELGRKLRSMRRDRPIVAFSSLAPKVHDTAG